MTTVKNGSMVGHHALRHRIEEELAWSCRVPAYRDEAELSRSENPA